MYYPVIVIIVPIFIIAKFRLNIVILLIAISAVLLNFTIIQGKNIQNYQVESYEKVEARNYYGWLNMIINGKGFNKEVYTNFKEILHDKIPRTIEFLLSQKCFKNFIAKNK